MTNLHNVDIYQCRQNFKNFSRRCLKKFVKTTKNIRISVIPFYLGDGFTQDRRVSGGERYDSEDFLRSTNWWPLAVNKLCDSLYEINSMILNIYWYNFQPVITTQSKNLTDRFNLLPVQKAIHSNDGKPVRRAVRTDRASTTHFGPGVGLWPPFNKVCAWARRGRQASHYWQKHAV